MSKVAWTFPAGRKTIAKATGIVGNIATEKTVPATKIWLVTNIHIALTTDATAVNRYAKIVSQDIANALIFSNVSDAVAQNQTGIEKFFIMYLTTTGATRNALGYMLLTAGEDVVLSLTGGVAGDTYDYLIEYLEIDAP